MAKKGKGNKAPSSSSSSSIPIHEENPQVDDTTLSLNGSLYQVLGVKPSASHQEIRKAYHRLALQMHPDKNPDDENAKENFQKLQKVVSILGDAERRKLYDDTGCIDDEELVGSAVNDLCVFLRALFKEVTEEDISEFETKYRGSEEEKKDLLNLYTKFKGKMDSVFDWLMCCDPKMDAHRFKDAIDNAISAGEVKEWKTYIRWRNEVEKTTPLANPLKSGAKPKNEPEVDIAAIIAKRQTERKGRMESVFSSLTAKYGNPEDMHDEPDEAEFEAMRQRVESVEARKQGGKQKSKKI